jgi:Tfp pilus assembly protein PilF
MKKFFLLSVLFWVSVSLAQSQNPYERFNQAYFSGLKHWIFRDIDAAERDFQNCISYNDSVSAVYYFLAMIYREKKEFSVASGFIEKALKLSPGNKWYKKLQTEIQQQLNGKPREKHENVSVSPQTIRPAKPSGQWTYEQARRLAEKYPFDPEVLYRAARLAFEKEKYKEAALFLENGMDFAATRPDLLRKYYVLAVEVYKKLKRPDLEQKYRRLLKSHGG